MTINEYLLKTISSLKNLQIFNAQTEAEQLLSYVLDLSWSDLTLSKNKPFPENKKNLFEKSLKRRLSGEPLAYIRGYQDFYKFKFYVGPEVLIPRPETELIVENCLTEMRIENPIVFDLGTGSGCIGLSIAKERPQAQVWLFDSSKKAIEMAQRNAENLKVTNINWVAESVGESLALLENLKEKVDFVLANPPYIAYGDKKVEESVHQREPHEALYADDNGLKWIHKWLAWSYHYLRVGGLGFFEFGEGQTKDVVLAIEKTGFQLQKIIKDYSAKERIVLFKK